MPEVAPTARAVPHSRIRELADVAMRMDAEARKPSERVLRLFFGESNLPTPAFLKEAAHRAMLDGYTMYTENAGIPSLRRALALQYERLHNVSLNPASEIVVTNSGVQALNVGIRCALDPGDEAIVLTPAWPNQSSNVRMCNATPREIPLVLQGGCYAVDFDALEAAVTSRTRLLIYTSPSNPSGWVATLDEQRRLLDFARRHGLWLMADEVYERLWYSGSQPLGAPAPSILKLATRSDAVMVAQSFSKSYCMTGWRLGWLVARADLAERATQLNEFIISCAPGFVQKAAEVALSDGEASLREMLTLYKTNRDFCVNAFRQMPGVTLPSPDGAFYVFPRIDGLADSFDFCERLLLETRVGLAPGVAFGAGGEGSIRLCYAVEAGILEPALARIGEFVERPLSISAS
ncbi:MAG: pyridoxal phosphate-dependent aminotransferase [Terracidiphilus sp.]|nr:pyridoxal phosphate-dependent aminotransferase [Terracidiphilus sp.]